MSFETRAGFDLRPIRKQLGKRGEASFPPRPKYEALLQTLPWDTRPLPYYSIVPEQCWKNNADWNALSWQDKGLFRLLCDWLWLHGGGVMRHEDLGVVARSIGIELIELQGAITRLLDADFLYIQQNRIFQIEMREQYMVSRGRGSASADSAIPTSNTNTLQQPEKDYD